VVTAAWAEALDRLYEAGLGDGPVIDALTGSEVAALTGERFGAEAARHATGVGTVAEAATYRRATAVLDADVTAAWQAQRELVTAVNAALGVRGRFRASIRYRYAPRRRDRVRSHLRRSH
jgi:hypothetical protein